MFKNWKLRDTVVSILSFIVLLLGGNEVYQANAPDIPVGLSSDADPSEMYTIAASFQVPDGGGAVPSFSDDIGPEILEVPKPSPAAALAAFQAKYPGQYSDVQVRKISVLKTPTNPPGDDDDEVQTE